MTSGPSSSSPFLIIGAQRSGTSLLSRILNQHPNLAVPGESFFFNTFGPLRRYYGDLSLKENRDRLIDDALSTPKIREWRPPPPRAAVEAKVREHTLGGVFRAILDAWAEMQGKRRWGEKTPQHVLHWPDVHEALPDAPLLHIVRDGRDVALSLIAARFGPKTPYAAARRWQRYMSAIREIKASSAEGQLHEIRYEDLLQRPMDVLRGVCAFLGERYTPRMLEFHKNTTAGIRYKTEHRNLVNPLMPQNAARWRRSMSMEDLRVVEGVIADELEAHGYALATQGAPLRRVERFYFECIVDPPKKGLALMRNTVAHAEELHLTALRSRIISRHGLRVLTGRH